MFKYILLSSACVLPVKIFADIQVGDSNSPFKVYGVLDYGVNYSHSGAGSSHDFQSGMDYASRLGLKLNIKLNDDLAIVGNAESWIDLRKMDFVRDETFARGEYIGVSSKKYGTVLYGRQMLNVSGVYEELFASSFAPATLSYQAYDLGTGAPTFDFRSSRAITYTTPKFNNITLSFLYTPNQMVGDASKVLDAKNYGAMAVYDDGVNRISASYNELVSNYSVNYNGIIYDDIKTKDYRLFALKRLNKNLFITGTANYLKPDSPDAVSAQIYGTMINFEQPKYNLKAALYHRQVDKKDMSAMIYAVGANYHINKHLDAYVRAEYIDNNSKAKYTMNNILLEGPGDDPSSYGIGLKFMF
ncbi:porin [Acinetobacter baumannii]